MSVVLNDTETVNTMLKDSNFPKMCSLANVKSQLYSRSQTRTKKQVQVLTRKIKSTCINGGKAEN